MDTLEHMKLFCRIVEAGSMAAVAREFGLAPATVTGAVARMEERFGVRLLNRTTRRISTTEAGQVWYDHARNIVEQAAEADAAVRRLAQEPQGRLRVTLTRGVAHAFVYPHLQEFSARYPAIELDFQVNDRIVDLVEQQFDLALRVGKLQDSDHVARLLLRYQRVTCASPDYLARFGAPPTPADLAKHNCLVYRTSPQPAYWDYWIDGRVEPVQVQGRQTSNDSAALLAWACNGDGIARFPTWYVASELRRGVLVTVLDDFLIRNPAHLPGVYALLPRARHLPAKVQAFLDFLSGKFNAGEAPHHAGGD